MKFWPIVGADFRLTNQKSDPQNSPWGSDKSPKMKKIFKNSPKISQCLHAPHSCLLSFSLGGASFRKVLARSAQNNTSQGGKAKKVSKFLTIF
jgi:hypothetical protein